MNITISIDDNEIISVLKQVFDGTAPENRTTNIRSLREKTKNVQLDAMGFSVRTLKCLERFDIKTLDKLLSCTPTFLRQIRNFGRQSMQEIEKILGSHEYSICSIPPIWVKDRYSKKAYMTNGDEIELFKTENLRDAFILTENEKIFNT